MRSSDSEGAIPTVLLAARLFNPLTGSVVRDAAVVVDGARIAAAGPAREVGLGRAHMRIDLGDRTLMPGLIDGHVHLMGVRSYSELLSPLPAHRDLRVVRAAEDCRRLLMAGFTTVRECGSVTALGLRKAVLEGVLPGPSIHASGPILCQTGGHADTHRLPVEWVAQLGLGRLVDSPWDGRKAVREAVRSEAEFIKICTTGGIGSELDHPNDSHFTAEEIGAIVDEAHRLGRKVASHSQGREGIIRAVNGGVDTIEHGYYLDQETARAMARRGTALVPTHALAAVFERSLADPGDMPPWRLRKQREALSAMRASVGLDAGVVIGAGSDFLGMPGRAHGDNAEEAVALVSAGMTHIQALTSLTLINARIIGCEADCGSLEAGKLADLAAFEGDPTASIECLRSPAFVMRYGRIVRNDAALPETTRVGNGSG